MKKASLQSQLAVKRLFDIFTSLVIIGGFLPVWVVIAAWVKLSSPGPIFFKQVRTGLKGADFEMFKFRTMVVNNEADTVQADSHDPRITSAGHFLRKTSLDEIPQLLNVLKGDMSVIGPRPHMVYHTEYYSARIPGYMERHDMRPGLTGYAQIQGLRNDTPTLDDMRRRVEADVYYIRHFSLALDLRIIFTTALRIVTLKL